MLHISKSLTDFKNQFKIVVDDKTELIRKDWHKIVGESGKDEIKFITIKNNEIRLKTSSPRLVNKWKYKAKMISVKVSEISEIKGLLNVRINNILIECK
jgi:hypothetical protein